MIYAKGPDSRRASLFVEAEEGLRACLKSQCPEHQQAGL